MQSQIDEANHRTREAQAATQQELEGRLKAEKETDSAHEALKVADADRIVAKRECIEFQQEIAELKRYRKILQQQYQELMVNIV